MSGSDDDRGSLRYRAIIQLTTQSIQHRARQYRNLVIAVVIVGGACACGALLSRSLVPLVGLTLLLPICGGFLAVDAMVVERWRSVVLRDWTARSIDITALRAAIRANPVLPRMTTEGMLTTLPVFRDLVEEQRLSHPSREALAAGLVSTWRAASDSIALKTAASSLAALVLITAVASRSWTPVWGLVALAALPMVRGWLLRRRLDFQVTPTAPPQAH